LTIHVFACEISLKRDCNFRGSGNGLGPNLDLVLTPTTSTCNCWKILQALAVHRH